jgi:hypothetical protein
MTALPSRWLFCVWFGLTSLAPLLAACGHEIGDDCSTSLDCSAQNSRLCDRTQPGGYCTIAPCERGTCPGESTCVEFRPSEERLAITYCMRECENDGDCRDDYRCTDAERFSTCPGAAEAKTLDSPKKHFCAAQPVRSTADAGVGPGSMCVSTNALRSNESFTP